MPLGRTTPGGVTEPLGGKGGKSFVCKTELKGLEGQRYRRKDGEGV